ncbi:MAG TPA: sulfotransferase, partial [Rhizomicrobium sp.]|nr:sulfotransferase [Rhizomicrobium sp.]
VFLDDGWTMAALDEIGKALALDANSTFSHIINGRILAELGRVEESLASHRRAVELDPHSVEPSVALAVALLSRGDSAEARTVLERAQIQHPNDVRIFLALCQNGRFRKDDARFADLDRHLENPDVLVAQKVELNFMAGKAYDDLKDYDKAFHYFSRANSLQAQNAKTASEEDQIALQTRIREIFTPEFVRSHEGVGSRSDLPIFVLGMPRSGTTLSEQVISSHPQVEGAGEVLDMEIAIKTLAKRHNINTPMPDLVTLLAPEDFRELGDIYAGRLTNRAPGGKHVTDKLPGNFNRVGLIHLALPNAKIIHCIRNPVDCCLSIYTNHFAEHLEHANDLYRLGRFYRRYHSLMQYWRETLPPGTFLDVKYEDTVSDLEAQARRIIAYCGLEWDPLCLDFQNNKRQVSTLSITQVRQPLYKTSVERWRPYEKYLGPLLDGLGDLAPPH